MIDEIKPAFKVQLREEEKAFILLNEGELEVIYNMPPNIRKKPKIK